MSFVTHFECPACGAHFRWGKPVGLCQCGSPLLVRYDLGAVRLALKKGDLCNRPSSLWRYRELLPVDEPLHAVTLGEGMTPLLTLPRLSELLGIAELLVKDEGLNPTGTFKSRGASVGVTRARELGLGTLAVSSSGSAASAWAVYGARGGLDVVVVLRHDAPVAYENESALAGAHVIRTAEGEPRTPREIIQAGVREHGWFAVTAMAEPQRVEGKKTIAFELAEQMGWQLPDFIIQPTGGGVGLIGMAKAFDELEAIDWIGSIRPRLVAAQSSAMAPVVDAIGSHRGRQKTTGRTAAGQTIAWNLAVPRPIGLNLVVDAIERTDGWAAAVDDDEILRWIAVAAEAEGVMLGPEGGAALAVAAKLAADRVIHQSARVVVINTSSAVRYPDVVGASMRADRRRGTSRVQGTQAAGSPREVD